MVALKAASILATTGVTSDPVRKRGANFASLQGSGSRIGPVSDELTKPPTLAVLIGKAIDREEICERRI